MLWVKVLSLADGVVVSEKYENARDVLLDMRRPSLILLILSLTIAMSVTQNRRWVVMHCNFVAV